MVRSKEREAGRERSRELTVGRGRGRTGKGRSGSEGMDGKAARRGEKNGKEQGKLVRRERIKSAGCSMGKEHWGVLGENEKG
jgi:hypothetical protein